MSEEKQAETSVENSDAGSSNDDAVVEQREAKKQGSYIGTLLLIAVLIGAGVAAGYYQRMWLPQAKQLLAKYIPAQQESDPMAAPRLQDVETEQTSIENDSPSYALLPAITKEEPAKEVSKDVVEELPVIAATIAIEPAAKSEVSDDIKEVINDVVMDEEPVINSTPVETTENVPAVNDDAVIEQVKTPVLAPIISNTNVASLSQARQAFWARDLVKAETLYRELLNAESNSADAWGELGNLYYGQAKWQQAAESYSEAAIQLLEQGQYQRAMFLHYVVRGLDPAQAARIDEKLRAMQTTPQG